MEWRDPQGIQTHIHSDLWRWFKIESMIDSTCLSVCPLLFIKSRRRAETRTAASSFLPSLGGSKRHSFIRSLWTYKLVKRKAGVLTHSLKPATAKQSIPHPITITQSHTHTLKQSVNPQGVHSPSPSPPPSPSPSPVS